MSLVSICIGAEYDCV